RCFRRGPAAIGPLWGRTAASVRQRRDRRISVHRALLLRAATVTSRQPARPHGGGSVCRSVAVDDGYRNATAVGDLVSVRPRPLAKAGLVGTAPRRLIGAAGPGAGRLALPRPRF